MPPVDWDKALWHLPTQDILKSVSGPTRHLRRQDAGRDRRPDGAARAQRSDAWRKGGLWHDDMALNVPGLWFMSWYDVSVGPNLEMFNHVRKNAKGAVADQQWAVIAPVAHCSYTRATEDTIVGERSMGDARLDYNDITYGFFDKFLKGEANTRLDKMPKVTYYTMGSNKWQTAGHLAAGRRAADDVLSGERRRGQFAERRRHAGGRSARRRQARYLHLRPDEPGDVVRRQRLLHGNGDPGRLVRPAQDGIAQRHPGLHLGGVQGGHGSERPDHADAVRVVRREGHRLHREGARRLSRWPRLQPRRVDPADALSRRLRQARVDRERQGLQGHAAAAHHQQLLRRRPPAAHRGVEQQLPALRSQPEHRREQLRRGQGRGGEERGAPLEALSVERHRDRGQENTGGTGR